MRRADRLFEIVQVLRRASKPLTADTIAKELETSRWTIYRDMAALVAQRIPIRSEAGVGYILERGFDLPPLMLTTDEIEAVTLGAQLVIANAEPALARAALDVRPRSPPSCPTTFTRSSTILSPAHCRRPGRGGMTGSTFKS
ncbi:helix-turn-helix transcriptional regulator [uncultured Brevundimonas sp.]|uniref:helix-turn-helix transcriptional regulator n=1 Tax=uncultured Brevundimonas sp. TaxID=213418 RepID=UPI00345DA297